MCTNLSTASNSICCVMVSMLALSALDLGFVPRSGQIKYYKIGICCFKHKREGAKICWLGIGIMSLVEGCCSEMAVYNSNEACWFSTKRTSSSSQSLNDMAEKLLSWHKTTINHSLHSHLLSDYSNM